MEATPEKSNTNNSSSVDNNNSNADLFGHENTFTSGLVALRIDPKAGPLPGISKYYRKPVLPYGVTRLEFNTDVPETDPEYLQLVGYTVQTIAQNDAAATHVVTTGG
eukprot:UC1_evm1s920